MKGSCPELLMHAVQLNKGGVALPGRVATWYSWQTLLMHSIVKRKEEGGG